MSSPLELLRSAQRVGWVFSGGSARCAFQVGVVETLMELGLRPGLCVGVSGGAWNAAAVAAGTGHRLRHYWRCFVRMPHVDFRNVVRERTPYAYSEVHRRTFARYVGVERLIAPEALPLWIGVTRLRDKRSEFFSARDVEDPLGLMLASNYLPPFYMRAPRIGGERYGDGGMTNNIPYEQAFEQGCDAVVLITMKGEGEGRIYRHPKEPEHVIPEPFRSRTVVIRPRHRLPLTFTERRWPVLRQTIEIGRLRTREVLLGEAHSETEARAEGTAPTRLVLGLLARARSLSGERHSHGIHPRT